MSNTLRTIVYLLASLPLLVCTSCSIRPESVATQPGTPPIPGATPVAPLEAKPDVELTSKFAEIASAAGGRVGVMAVVIESSSSAGFNSTEHFPMLSVYKLPIAMVVMEQVRLGKRDLDEMIGVTKDDMVRKGVRSPLRDEHPDGGEFAIRDLIRLALVESDGTASDVLMKVAGGAEAVQAYLTQIGISDIRVANTEKEISRDWGTQYDNWASPAAALELLRYLKAGCGCTTENVDAEEGANLLLGFMTESAPGKNRLKGKLPPGTKVAHKTGTSGTRNGITAGTNDIGIIELPNGKHIAIAVFISDSPADEKTRDAVIARLAEAAWNHWVDK